VAKIEGMQMSQKTLFGGITKQKPEAKSDLRHAKIIIETIKEEKWHLRHSVFCIPYWDIEYRCDGCFSRCGGGRCCQTIEKVDRELAYYRNYLQNCPQCQKLNRRIKVDVEDDRKRQIRL
jgi:hypothetical protein